MCVWEEGIFLQFVAPQGAETWCELDAVHDVRPARVEPFAFAAHDNLIPPLYQSAGYADYDWEVEGVVQKVRYLTAILTDQSRYDGHVEYLPIAIVGVVVAATIAVLLFILKRGLTPLRSLRKELDELWKGNIARIEDAKYPEDLARLANSLNGYVIKLRQAQARTYDSYAALISDLHHEMEKALYAAADEDSNTRYVLKSMALKVQETTQKRIAMRELVLVRDERVEVCDTVQMAISWARSKHVGKNIEFRCVSDMTVLSSLNSFQEAIAEVLENACKYSKSTVVVTVRVVGTDEGVQIDVEDDGQGFPEEVDKVWEPGWRGTPNGTVKGAGIGLFQVHMHMGACLAEIVLENSESLPGALVTLRFPKQRLESLTEVDGMEQHLPEE